LQNSCLNHNIKRIYKQTAKRSNQGKLTVTLPWPSPTSCSNNSIPDQAHDTAQCDSNWWWNIEPSATDKARSSNNHPPRIYSQARSLLMICIDITDLEESVDGRKNQTNSAS